LREEIVDAEEKSRDTRTESIVLFLSWSRKSKEKCRFVLKQDKGIYASRIRYEWARC